MRSWSCAVLLGLVLFLGVPSPGLAGMAGPTLEDIPRLLTLSNMAKLRLDAVSFFVACLLGIAWVIQRVWNSLATDFPRIPRISYQRSLGVMGLWGLLFLLVLTMISGARELMTPGAWKKNGLTYQLTEPTEASAPSEKSAQERP